VERPGHSRAEQLAVDGIQRLGRCRFKVPALRVQSGKIVAASCSE
jgi:hypothetical protein